MGTRAESVVLSTTPLPDTEFAFHAVSHRLCDRPGEFDVSYVTSDRETARGNREMLCAALGVDLGSVVCVQQVHGDRVARVGREHRGRGAFGRADVIPGADALIADERGVTLMVMSADCTPILLLDPRRRAIGAVHAGWRGTSLAIARRAVEAMARELGSEPGALHAYVGPSIGPCCYEVSHEVAEAVQAATSAGHLTRPGPRGRPYLDLAAANRAQLIAAGLREDRVCTADACTSCQVDRYFSHRAQHGKAGRFAAVIGLRE